jgi:hypothetical protein
MNHDPIFEKVLLSESSFLIKEEHFKHFDIPWHTHPKFELTYIEQGQGKLNSMEKERAAGRLKSMLQLSDFERTIELLQILHGLASAERFKIL